MSSTFLGYIARVQGSSKALFFIYPNRYFWTGFCF